MDAATTNLFLCLDQGGHASRAIVFDNHGQLHAKAYCEVATQRDGSHVEHDPEQMVESLVTVAHEVIEQLGSSSLYLAAAGLATQRSSVVCWDRSTGMALSPVISWQDVRAASWLEQYAGQQTRIHTITGLVLSPHYGVSKLRWCLDNLPAVREAGAAGQLAFGPLASFLAGRLATQAPLQADPANASRTLLWDRRTRDWSDELLELFEIPRECLPVAVPSRSDWGNLILDELTLPIDIVTGDQSAALYAFGEPQPGTVYANLGTGAFLQRVVEDQDVDPGRLLASIVYQDEYTQTQVVEGTVNGAGSAVNYVAQELGVPRDEFKAQSAAWLEDFSLELLFINTVSGLGSPWWIADVQPGFVGRAAADADNAARIAAVLESIAFLLAVNAECMGELLGKPERMLVTGGLGTVAPLLQRIADLCGLPVERTTSVEATARGLACLLAGIPDAWPAAVIADSFEPQRNAVLAARYEQWREAMPPIG